MDTLTSSWVPGDDAHRPWWDGPARSGPASPGLPVTGTTSPGVTPFGPPQPGYVPYGVGPEGYGRYGYSYEPPPEILARRRRNRALTTHICGVLISALSSGAAAIASILWLLAFTYCDGEPAGFDASMHRWGVLIAVVWAAVPAAWALLCVRLRVAWLPWAIVAGVFLVTGLSIALTAHPSELCLFGGDFGSA
jgi:hypothetical protein